MSRSDQYIGLNTWASKWVQDVLVGAKVIGKEKIERTFLDPSRPPEIEERDLIVRTTQMKKIGEIHGAWDDNVADLHSFTLEDGSVYEEYVQATPWSSGPCYFVALKKDGQPVPESLWTDQEIGDA